MKLWKNCTPRSISLCRMMGSMRAFIGFGIELSEQFHGTVECAEKVLLGVLPLP